MGNGGWPSSRPSMAGSEEHSSAARRLREWKVDCDAT